MIKIICSSCSLIHRKVRGALHVTLKFNSIPTTFLELRFVLFLIIIKYRVVVPNKDRKKLHSLVEHDSWLFYIQSKIFLYFHNPWKPLFPMIYKWALVLNSLMEISVVYDQGLYLSLLGTKNCWMSLLESLFFNQFWKSSHANLHSI